MEPSSEPKPYVIVVAVDFSPLSTEALKMAQRFAAGLDGVVVHAVHVVPGPYVEAATPSTHADLVSETLAQLQAYLSSVGSEARPLVIVGIAQHVLPLVARSLRASLLVLGTHGRKGLSRLFLGSVAESVMRHAPCSVLTVR